MMTQPNCFGRLEKRNIDRYILLLKNVTENLKNRKKWAFLYNPRALFKKISIILALFW